MRTAMQIIVFVITAAICGWLYYIVGSGLADLVVELFPQSAHEYFNLVKAVCWVALVGSTGWVAFFGIIALSASAAVWMEEKVL